MSNLYQLTKKIHELLPQVIAKYGLMEFEIESDYWYHTPKKSDFKNRIFHYSEIPNHFYNFETKHLKDYFIPAIQHLQIRQILFVLSRVLGENPELLKINNGAFGDCRLEYSDNHYLIVDYCDDIREIGYIEYAEALCQKWLGGLKPLFNRESKTVLQELVEILENLLK